MIKISGHEIVSIEVIEPREPGMDTDEVAVILMPLFYFYPSGIKININLTLNPHLLVLLAILVDLAGISCLPVVVFYVCLNFDNL